MTQVPAHLLDAKDLLTAEGFKIGDMWYHGTSSALLDSINEQGLRRSGDKALKQSAKNTMSIIGNNYTESIEPVFLTQSKELAYYWAEQAVRDRSVRFEGDEKPVVLAVSLSDEQRAKVKPDVGAVGLLLIEGQRFMSYLAAIYQRCGAGELDIDLMKADRMDYLNLLGMAYIDQNIDKQYVKLLNE